jgi:predicted site-specific integrase-resolvase
MVCNFVSRQEISQRLGISAGTLKRYRLGGRLIEGLHWVRLNSRCTRYNFELIRDWLQNRDDRAAHQRAIEVYQASLLSNQPLPSGKRRKSA